jgi:hypothetical protein
MKKCGAAWFHKFYLRHPCIGASCRYPTHHAEHNKEGVHTLCARKLSQLDAFKHPIITLHSQPQL